MKTFLSALACFSLSLLFFAVSSYSLEVGTDFENGIPPNFTADGWGLRDVTTCQWGPQIATSGTQCVGVPETCLPTYPNGNWRGFFTTPHITLGDSFPSVYLSYNYWADLEGVTAVFDGVILEFINLSRGDTVQLDSLATMHLSPTYDAVMGASNTWLVGRWAYCYDSITTLLNPLGFPYTTLFYSDTSGGNDGIKPRQRSFGRQQIGWKAVQTVDLIAAGYADQGDVIAIRFYFASDPLSSEDGYFIDDVYISNTPPQDEVAPIINVASPAPYANITTENTPIPVKAVVVDVSSGVLQDSVFMVYTIEDDPTETIVPMTSVPPDTFVADVEALPYDTDVYYKVIAYDTMFNKGTSVTHTFEVTDAVTMQYDDGIPYWVTYNAPEIGSGFSSKFNVPSDSLFILHKVMIWYGTANGLFDVVVNIGGGLPGTEIARYDSLTNGDFAGIFYQFQLPDSIAFQGPTQFWVGMRHVSVDTLLDPGPGVDETKEYMQVCYQYFGNAWTEVTSGETMIRAKVKKISSVGIEDGNVADVTLPRVFALSQNYPNPFNPQTVIKYDVPESVGSGVLVTIDIYNIHGQRVTALVNNMKEPGAYTAHWDGRNDLGELVSSGIYFYRIKAGDFTSTRKMVLLK